MVKIPVLLIFFLSTSFSQLNFLSEPDFRDVKWGYSIDKVKATEQATFKHDGKYSTDKETYIVYQTEVLGLKTTLTYYFLKNNSNFALVAGEYRIYDVNEDTYNEEVNKLTISLNIKYGDYKEENPGKNSILKIWNTTRSTIIMEIKKNPDPYDVITLSYSDKKAIVKDL